MFIVHVTCGLAADEIAAGQARGVEVSGETCLQYLTNTVDDLARPDFEGARYVCSPPLREAHNQELLWRALRRGVLESVSTDHCPFNSEQKALGRDDFSKIPNGLAMIQHRLVKLWDLGVAGGRITPSELVDLTSTTIARRFGLARKGTIAPGMDADLVVFDPVDAVRVLDPDLAHERRLRPVRGRDLVGQRAPHVLPRHAGLRPRRDRHRAGPRPLRPALARRDGRRRVVMDADRVIADLRELAELTGGPDGARRVCWTDEWVKARELVRSKLEELPVEITTDAAGNVWADLPGEQEGFVIVGSHVDSVPAGGWLDGALGLFAALEVLRAHADEERPVGLRFVDWADEEGARFGRSLFGSSACAGTLEIDEVRDLKDRDGERLEDVVGRYDVDLAKVHESGAQLKGARAYLELHIEQGPVLEARDESAAAVLGTVGVERRAAVFSGRASHAGATPMDMRQDSFLRRGHARRSLIRDVGLAHEGGYCTTGGASSDPGVVTAVAGRTELLLDQRHLDADELAAMLKEADEACEQAAEEFGCTVEMKHLWSIPPIPFDDRLIGFAKDAIGTDTAIPSGRSTTPPRWRG